MLGFCPPVHIYCPDINAFAKDSAAGIAFQGDVAERLKAAVC